MHCQLQHFLDPRFKILDFKNENIADSAKKKVIAMVTAHLEESAVSSQFYDTVMEDEQDDSLSVWSSLDKRVASKRPRKGTSMSRAIIEVNRYLEDDVLPKNEDPLKCWRENQYNYPHLGKVVQEQFCALGTSVPCERI